LFEAQVAQTPTAVAVALADERLKYRELNARANQLAHRLRRLGVGPDVLVAVCMKRSLEMVVGLLGVLKAGGAYVPLDPAHPQEHLAFLLEDTQAPILLTQPSLLHSLPKHEASVLCLEPTWQAIVGERRENPQGQVSGDSLAYVIYTSGSTGRPKGVMVPHRAVVNYLTWCVDAYAAVAGTGAPVQSPLTFDLTVTSLFAPLLTGRTVQLLPDGDAISALRTVFRTPADFSLVKITPAHLELLGQQIVPQEAAGRARAFIIGGENLTSRHIAFWRTHAPDTLLVNEYGPTETAVGCCVYAVPSGKHLTGPIPIGRPIANTQGYVLDPQLRPVPAGTSGELYIGGAGVARGYLNRPDLTAVRFLPDPFTCQPGARMYRTGDLVRALPDGNLEFLGRIDRQVKICGFRIELEEVELALASHPSVRQVVVLAREDPSRKRRLVAYVVPQPGEQFTAAGLRTFLKSRLPDYMVPPVFLRLDELPLSPNGKVDLQALPPPPCSRLELTDPFISPRDTPEAQMVRLWEEILGIRPIGVRDNFFELGGDSLLAACLFARIRKVYGPDLPPGSLLKAPTVEQLVRLLEDCGGQVAGSSLVPLQLRGTRPPFFCVHAIGGDVLLFADLARCLGPDQPCYGLQSRRPSEGQPRPATLELLAAQYLEEVRAVQPEGPYYLGGFSFGGTVAFEMAQQLRAQGQAVGLLAILDQRSHPGQPGSRFRPRFFLEALKNIPFWIWYDLFHTSPAALLSRLRLRAWAAVRRVARCWRRPADSANRAAENAGAAFDLTRLPEEYRALLQYHFQMLLNYVPRPYRGRVTLFRARAQPLSRLQGWDLGWGQLAGEGVELCVVPGSHDTLLRAPYVGVLAERLRVCLAKAQAAAPRHTRAAPLASDASPLPTAELAAARPFATGEEHVAWRIVVNHQGQYSIWPASCPAVPGWTVVGPSGTREECLGYIRDVWIDMRPLSLQQVQQDSQQRVAALEF
jgi:amino acid adenylation domain-containing protein